MKANYNNSGSLVLTFTEANDKTIRQKFMKKETVLWLYLGKDFFKSQNMEARLGEKFNRINIAKLQGEVAKDIRLEYTMWIDNLNRTHGEKLDWWFSSISSRNVSNCNLFQYACYLEILRRLWESNEKKPELVVVESMGLAKAIHKWALSEGVSIKTINYYGANLLFLKQYFSPFIYYAQFIAVQILKQTAAIISRLKLGQKNLKDIPFIIIDTFIHDTSISEDGNFKDRYYPFLYEYLKAKGFHLLVHPVLSGFRYNYFSIYGRMRKSESLFIVPEDFLNLFDYFYALSHPIKVLTQKVKTELFRNFDLYDILKEERRKQPFSLGMQAALIYRLFIKLGLSGIRPLQIINWYENQVIDKALIAGARKAFPNINIIGAQLFLHPPNYLSLFPTQSEADAKLAPDILLETSEYQCRVVQEFTTAIPCLPVAALRYAHIFESESNNTKPKDSAILVLLPFDIQEAVELLLMLKNILYLLNKQIVILIKCHPDYSIKKLSAAFSKYAWPSRFEIFTDNIKEALNTASMVVSASSSSMVEAATKGIPVIFIGRQAVLNQNHLANLDSEIFTECFSAEELIAAINRYLNLAPEKIREYKRIGTKLRDMYFTDVSEETMQNFITKHTTLRQKPCCTVNDLAKEKNVSQN